MDYHHIIVSFPRNNNLDGFYLGLTTEVFPDASLMLSATCLFTNDRFPELSA